MYRFLTKENKKVVGGALNSIEFDYKQFMPWGIVKSNKAMTQQLIKPNSWM
jgi:hypothetical protein